MTTLLWVLGGALVALVLTRVALQLRVSGKSRMYALAREYLEEQLVARGIAEQVPARCVTAIAERYASAIESRPLGRLTAASRLMRHIDAAVAVIAQWVSEGREFPPSIAEMPLPALEVPDELQEPDIPDADS
jgi:hypothetical protein